MTQSARPGLRVVAVWSALSLGAAARAASGAPAPPAPPAPECDPICELGHYLARDHMVTLAPATDPDTPGPALPAARPAKAKAPPRTAATRVPQPPRRTEPLAARSPVRPAAPAPVVTARAAAQPRAEAARAAIIPGSAPLVTSQFEPPR